MHVLFGHSSTFHHIQTIRNKTASSNTSQSLTASNYHCLISFLIDPNTHTYTHKHHTQACTHNTIHKSTFFLKVPVTVVQTVLRLDWWYLISMWLKATNQGVCVCGEPVVMNKRKSEFKGQMENGSQPTASVFPAVSRVKNSNKTDSVSLQSH